MVLAQKMRRIGEATKCPACGSGVDSGAYRCPRCLIYFCYKCRVRVDRNAAQFQCANQSCSCHGKLVCSACTVIVTQLQGRTKRELVSPELRLENWNSIRLAIVLIVAGLLIACAFVNLSAFVLLTLAILGIASFYDGSGRWPKLFTLRRTTVIPAEWRLATVEHEVDHRSCIECRQPVTPLR